MPQVLVRELEPTVVEQLKERARRNGRSLEAELRLILKAAAEETAPQPLEAIKRVQELFDGRQFSDSTDLIREDRER